MFFEHHTQPLLPRAEWILRLLNSLRTSVLIICGSLLIGILGYHFMGNLKWIDAFLESSMILSGMGSIAVMQNDAVKVFAACYALFSSFVLLTTFAIVMAPVLHRFLHNFHAVQKGDHK